MARSSIMGGERAPQQAKGRNADTLGPSDTSDSGSDIQGASRLKTDAEEGQLGGATPGRDRQRQRFDGHRRARLGRSRPRPRRCRHPSRPDRPLQGRARLGRPDRRRRRSIEGLAIDDYDEDNLDE
jgi:hypothetical protein